MIKNVNYTKEKLPLTLLNSPKIVHLNAFSELEMDVNKLDEYWQSLAENKRKQEQHILIEKIEAGVQELTILADKINNSANEIKTLMLSFKEIAVEVNRNYHLIQQTFNFSLMKLDQSKRRLRPLNIWDIHSSTIPTVVRHGAKFILTKKIVDLFKP